MFHFDAAAYGPAIAALLQEDRLPPLGPGTPNRAMRPALDAATTDRLFAGKTVRDRAMAESARSGLWLYHDFLDESHTISQGINTTTGSYWHGIMHRREPDFSNAAYWFRRVGEHPIFASLAAEAARLAAAADGLKATRTLATCTRWEPFDFVRLCEAVYDTPGPDHELCRAISRVEWRLLFDYSYHHAVDA